MSSRVLVTGSAEGLGLAAASLLDLVLAFGFARR